MRRWVVLAVAALAAAGCAVVTTLPTGELSAAACKVADAETHRALGPDWGPFLPNVDACDVKDADGRTVLSVVSVSASRYYAGLHDGVETTDFPKPILVTPAGRVVGRLPMSFPDDPPFALRLNFSDWHEGWPERVELFAQDPTVIGDHELEPLIWSPGENFFVQGGRDD